MMITAMKHWPLIKQLFLKKLQICMRLLLVIYWLSVSIRLIRD